ncbi:MAG: GNAT family N-acetyltransferase [Thermoleophilaceae bacterium]|nr:GNAT family N-acetyltransferase [Thermoleophilaceae bacterium]
MVERLRASMQHFMRLLGQASDGARTLERDGVVAAVVPACPERAVLNSVTYTEAGGLADAYEEIAAAYAEIGATWTVWVHHGDRNAAALLEPRGHFLDAEPEAMGRELDGVERPPDRALSEWTAAGRIADVGSINDRSYAFGTDSFTRGLARFPEDQAHVYTASQAGEPVACLMTLDHERNTDIEWVAVVPEARGRGLSGKLLAHALADARERGAETTTLVATRLGRPVYDRLGYRPLGALQMWERRRPKRAGGSPRT